MQKFKDKMGRWRTNTLFQEWSDPSYEAYFTIYDWKHNDPLPCLKTLFLECGDPTEYIFATTYLGGWEHWQKLQKHRALEVNKWREELELKLRADGIQQQIKLAEKGNSNAAKWVAEKGWSKRKAGAPSKAEVERETKIAAKLDESIEEDYSRLFN